MIWKFKLSRLASAAVIGGALALPAAKALASDTASNPAAGYSQADVVRLPGGDSVAIGGQGSVLLAAADTGRVEEILWHLIDEGRDDDAVAVLGYVARHRPEFAVDLAVLGVSVIAEIGDGERAADIIAVIVAESGADPETVLQAVRAAGLPVETADVSSIADLEPASGPDTGPDGLSDAPPGSAADAIGGAAAPIVEFSGQGGGASGLGGGLPPGLFVGGGGGGGASAEDGPADDPGVVDPPADAGVS